MDELGVPFLYDTMYEGGVADHFTFCVSSVPEQNILPAVDYLAERGARRFFIIVTDYSYGILTAECIKHHLTARGCEVCGIEYFQQEKSRFDVTIENILEAQPDALITSLLGSNQNRFHEVWAQRGDTTVPVVSHASVCHGFVHKLMEPSALENLYFSTHFLEEDARPAARAWVQAVRKECPTSKVPYLGCDQEAAYLSLYLYRAAVELAGFLLTAFSIQINRTSN